MSAFDFLMILNRSDRLSKEVKGIITDEYSKEFKNNRNNYKKNTKVSSTSSTENIVDIEFEFEDDTKKENEYFVMADFVEKPKFEEFNGITIIKKSIILADDDTKHILKADVKAESEDIIKEWLKSCGDLKRDPLIKRGNQRTSQPYRKYNSHR